jgi:hypothetical protein
MLYIFLVVYSCQKTKLAEVLVSHMVEISKKRVLLTLSTMIAITAISYANQYDFTILTDNSSSEDFRCTVNEVTDPKGYIQVITALSCVPVELRAEFEQSGQMKLLTGAPMVYGENFNSENVDAVVRLKNIPEKLIKKTLQIKSVTSLSYDNEVTLKLPIRRWIAGKYGHLKNVFNNEPGRRGMCIVQEKMSKGVVLHTCSHMLVAKSEPRMLEGGIREDSLYVISLIHQRLEALRLHSKNGKAIWLGLFSDTFETEQSRAEVQWNYR